MVFVVLLGYQSKLVVCLHGIANGVMIEGASRWGYDPVWKGNPNYILNLIP